MRLLRPCLSWPKARLVATAQAMGLPLVSDPSNADPAYERARLRADMPRFAALGLTRMSLQELKDKPPVDLLAFAEQLEIENANSMSKQDMMFAIL